MQESKKLSEASGLLDPSRVRSKVRDLVSTKIPEIRTNVTGGKHFDGFIDLFSELIEQNCPEMELFTQTNNRDPATVLPGYFRPTKMWNFVIIYQSQLVGCLELKSHIGPSFGNNYNNRSEEAVGVGHDLQVAYREGAFKPSSKPWIGYLMILEETSRSTSPVKVEETHFEVFEEFKDASYAKRYEVGINRLVREGLYSSACLMLTQNSSASPTWREPGAELGFSRLIASLLGHCVAVRASASC